MTVQNAKIPVFVMSKVAEMGDFGRRVGFGELNELLFGFCVNSIILWRLLLLVVVVSS